MKHKLGISYKKTLAHPRADAQARATFQARRAAYEVVGRTLMLTTTVEPARAGDFLEEKRLT